MDAREFGELHFYLIYLDRDLLNEIKQSAIVTTLFGYCLSIDHVFIDKKNHYF